MERDLARTLGELERKLAALEHTLHSITAPGAVPAAVAAGARAVSSAGAGRIVDEAIELVPSPDRDPVRPAASRATAHDPAPDRRAGMGRPGPAAPATSTAPPEATAVPARAPAPTRPQPSLPEAPAAPPTAGELLRFRDRLESAARELTHEYDELLGRLSYAAMPTATASTISFARGVPSLDIIDVEGLRDAAVRAFDSDPNGSTAYGTSVGYPRLRSWIAEHHGVEPERVLVTNGSLQADAFLFDQLVRPGDEVIVESPTYDRTLLSLRHRGAQVHAVALEQDGIDTEALGQVLADGAGAGTTLAHVIPNFQNPAGYTLSETKRRRLVELAREHDFVVLEDDPYVDLRFTGSALPTMVSMDPEHVVYASSFTKTVCPGVRVGYLVGPPALIAAIAQAATNTYISPGMVSQAIVYEFCAAGALERSIETVRTALARRAAALGQALRRELPDADFVDPQGGYFMWIKLPEGTDVQRLFELSNERGVTFVKGSDFMLEGGGNTLRLAYSGVRDEEIDAGVSRLAEAYRLL